MNDKPWQCTKCKERYYSKESAIDCCPNIKTKYSCTKCGVPYENYTVAINCCPDIKKL